MWTPRSIRSPRSDRGLEYEVMTPPAIAELSVRIPAPITGAAERVGLRLRELAELPHLEPKPRHPALLTLQEEWGQLPAVANTRADATVRDLVEILVAHPVVTVNAVGETLEVSKPTARSAITLLEEVGVLTETDAAGRATAWEAREVYAVLDNLEAQVHWPPE